MLSKITITFLILLVCRNIISAQVDNIPFDRITTENGLSNNMIRTITQDKTGFLWIGTNDGLNKYDGYEFTTYLHSNEDSTTISDNSVTALYEDETGFIWIGTRNGLNYFDPSKEEFIRYYKSDFDSASISSNFIRTLYKDHQGYLWIGTQTGSLNRYDHFHGGFTCYPVRGGNVSCIFEDHDGILWIGTARGELYRFNMKTGDFQHYINNLAEKIPIKENDIWFIREDLNNALIVGMAAGLYKFNKTTGVFTTFLPAFENLGSFRNNEFHCIYDESAGYLWLGTYGKGLYKYDMKRNDYVDYQLEPKNTNSLSNNDINFIFRDQSGVIWIGTQDGLNKADMGRGLFSHYQNIPGNPNSLSLNFVTSFAEDQNGILWIGTFGGGINKFNRSSGNFTHYRNCSNDPNSLIHDAVRALCIDNQKYIWIGTMYGVDRFDPKTGKFDHYTHDPHNPASLSGNDILEVIEDRYGMIWIGTYGDGLNKLDPQTGRAIRYQAKDSSTHGLKSDHIRTIMEDNQGFIWLGCVEGGGLYKYDPKRDYFNHYYNNYHDSLSIASNNINSIYEDKRGNLWIGTWNGLCLMDRETGKCRRFYTKEGLAHNKIVEILSDEENNIWISSHKGLSKLIFKTGDDYRFINYTLRQGIQGDEFTINASMKTHEGELVFGGTNGFNTFFPQEIQVNEFIPPVIITDFRIYNESVPVNKPYHGRVILFEHISKTDHIDLRFSDKVISFQFSALSYSLQYKNKYAYMLEGIDKDWVYTSAERRYATYTNLDPGEYIFRVKASNSDGVWNNTGTSIYLTIAPPIWKTWWAYVIYAVLVFLILMGIRKIVMIRVQLKNDLILERIEREKVEEINQLKLRFFTNISHEFKTPLTLILGPLEELISGTDKISLMIRNKLLLIHKNANRLLRLINQLMDFRKIERGDMELKVIKGDIVVFLEEIKKAFDDFAVKHKINYQFLTKRKSIEAWFDPDKLEKIFYNLLSNAFKFTPDGGSIIINIYIVNTPHKYKPANTNQSIIYTPTKRVSEKTPGALEITVEDSGIGISAERLPKIFDRFYKIEKTDRFRHLIEKEGSGIGLALTKNLIELHKGKIRVESEEGKGSTFTISLPLGKEHFTQDQILEEKDGIFDMRKYEVTSYLVGEFQDELLSEPDPTQVEEVNEKIPIVLIVEDHVELRSYLRFSLEPVYKIIEAGNGQQGLELATENIPDLIISDIMMPGMDGIELCRKLKTDERTSHIPLILLTAKDTIEDKIQGFETGADEYIAKPFNISLLTIRVKNLIELRQKLRDDICKKILLEPKEKIVESIDDKFLLKIMQIVEDNLSDSEFNVDRFGELVNMSRMQLYRKLKALTCLSANEFIKTVRLKRAAQLLLQNSLTISEITYEVGFNDPKYFSKCFHKQYGMTPSRYAAEHST